MFFGIQFPPNQEQDKDKTEEVVLTSREDVLKLLKEHKKARFKAFPTEAEALAFSKCWKDPTQIEEEKKSSSDEGCPYSGLTPQQLKLLKEAISKNDADTVDKLSKGFLNSYQRTQYVFFRKITAANF